MLIEQHRVYMYISLGLFMTVKIIQSDLIKDQTNIYCLLIIRLIFVLQRNLLIVTKILQN